MRIKPVLPWFFALSLGSLTIAAADWLALDATGIPISFEGVTSNSGAQLPKHVITDSTGLNVLAVTGDGSVKIDTGAAVQPVSQSGTWTTSLIGSLPSGTNVIGSVNQNGSPWAFNLALLNGAVPSAANPLPTQLVTAQPNATLAPVSSTNGLPVTCVSGCGVAGAIEAAPPTFSAGGFQTEYAAVGDRACLWGAAGKVVRLKRFSVNAYDSAPVISVYKLIRRSTVNTGGSSAPMTVVPYDSLDAGTAGATALQYNGAPVMGTAAGDVATFTIYPSGQQLLTEIKFGSVDRGAKSVTLRSNTEGICINAITSNSNAQLTPTFEWTEELT